MRRFRPSQMRGRSGPVRSWQAPRGRARLVVLAGEVGGRWVRGETRDFLNQLARGKVRHEPAVLKRRVQQAWRMRWRTILSCSAAKAFAASLLELRGGSGVDGDT